MNLDKLLASLPPDVREQFLQHEIDARSRPAKPRLTDLSPHSLRSQSGDDLDQALAAHVEHALAEVADRPAGLLALPRGLQLCYLSFLVEAEAMNGGLHQFFWNPSGEFAALVAPALRELGAIDAAALFEQAIEVAHSEAPRRQRLHAEGSWEAFALASSESFLRTFDQAFCELAQEFPTLRAALVRDREAMFSSPAQ